MPVYYYRVRGYNTEHTSGYSDTVNVVTLPSPPLALEAGSVEKNSFYCYVGFCCRHRELSHRGWKLIFHLMIYCLDDFCWWYFLFCE